MLFIEIAGMYREIIVFLCNSICNIKLYYWFFVSTTWIFKIAAFCLWLGQDSIADNCNAYDDSNADDDDDDDDGCGNNGVGVPNKSNCRFLKQCQNN